MENLNLDNLHYSPPLSSEIDIGWRNPHECWVLTDIILTQNIDMRAGIKISLGEWFESNFSCVVDDNFFNGHRIKFNSNEEKFRFLIVWG